MMGNQSQLKKTGELIAVMIFLFITTLLNAQDSSVEASVSKNPVLVGEPFQITVTLSNLKGKVYMTEVPGLQFLYGPEQGSFMQNINGKTTVESTYSWTFKASKEGTVTIPSILVETTRGKLKTEPISLKVVSNNTTTNTGIDKDFTTAIEVNKRKLYIGEPLVVKYKIYNRYNNFSPGQTTIPEFDGFWTETKPNHQPSWSNEIINGKRYQVATMRVDVMYPQQTGTFDLSGFEMTGVVRSGFFSREEVSASSPPIKIEVLPLPPGKPDNYLGAFSELKMTVEPSRTSLKTNEALDLVVTFQGKGNMRLLPEIKPTWPVDFELFDPEIEDNISITESGASGKKVMRYIVIPRSAGQFSIPSFSYSYFNTQEKKYVELISDPIELTVEKGNGQATSGYSFNSKSDVQVLNQDIRYIRKSSGRQFDDQQPGAVLWFLIVPYLGLFAGWRWKKRRENEEKNPALARQRRAGKELRRWLSEAESHLNDTRLFYDALGRGLENYLMAKHGIERRKLNKTEIQNILTPIAGPESAMGMLQLLEKCDMARFAPISEANTRLDLEQANKLLKQLEER